MFLKTAILSLLFTVFVVSNANPTVFTNSGPVQGTTRRWLDRYNQREKKVSSFLGIPYAEPPIGYFRFKGPVPNEAWKGILHANTSKSICMHPGGGAEDCLYINLWKPDLQIDDPLPVFVWIPGGGFAQAADITEDVGTNFVAMTDFILVTFSYRHGPFGFLYTGEEGAPGNVGLLDQQLALKWTRNNILPFDGDPTSITLIGDGPGGASASYHLLAPGSQELFTRAIMMSGTAVAPWVFYTQKEAKAVAHKLFVVTNCSTADSVACLRKMDARHLQRISRPDRFSTITYRPFPFIPTIDGDFLTQDPSDYLRNGEFKKTEIMIGTNSNDGMTVVDKYIRKNPQIQLDKISDITSIIDSLMPGESRYRRAQVLQSYFTYSTYNDSVDLSDLSKLISDVLFMCPSIKLADYYSTIKEHVYYYEFVLSSSDVKIKIPGREIPYFLLIPYLEQENYTDEDRKMSKRISLYLTSFAASG